MTKPSSKSSLPVAEYIENGSRYALRDLNYLERADSFLFNDTMEIQMESRGKCRSRFMQPNTTPYSDKLRSFYLRDEATGKIWSVPFEPVQSEPQEFEFLPGVSDIQWRVVVDDVEAWIRLVIPRDEQVELWTITVTNKGRKNRTLTLFPYFPVGQLGWITQLSKFEPALNGIFVEYFPYYVQVRDYYKLRSRKNNVFFFGDKKPIAGETNEREFLGGRGAHDPAALKRPKLAGGEAHYEPSVIALQYPLKLASGKSATFNFAFGPAYSRKDAKRIARTYLKKDGIEKALKKVKAYLKGISPSVRIATPDSDLNNFVNNWLPHQVHFCGGLLRMDGEPCVRNAYQDAMGATFILPKKTRYWFITVYAHQDTDGNMPHGAPLADGVDRFMINQIPHRDMNVWPPLAISYYMKETGDTSILKEKAGFKDSKEKATIYEHVCRGLEWQLRDRTKRRLCRIGEGDWDDPLNMAGWKEKGESIWLTEALAIALDTWAEVADLLGDDKRAKLYRKEAEVSRQAINKLAWDGEWYARGTTDAGLWYGTKKDPEGKVFLNAQSWAMMSGATNSPKRLQSTIKAVDKYLMTDSGPMTMGPAFTSMREDIGKITQKTPGTGENGSVYSHAASFYAYGLYRVRQAEEAFRAIRVLLTGSGTNSLKRSQQLPLYIPNFYRGVSCGRTAGRASGHWGTGTVAWFYRTIVTELLGVRGEFAGLSIDPQLPKKWKEAAVWRQFRGAEFDIFIQKTKAAKKLQVILDGETIKGNLIPVQKAGTKHKVQVFIPRD